MIMLFLVVSCAQKEVKQEDITVGMILPLTGNFAFFGEQARSGALIALEEINDSNFKVIFDDEKCIPREAVLVYQKLKNDKVDFIIGPACTGSILAVASQVKNDQGKMLAVLDAGEEVSKQGNGIYALGFDSEEEGYLIAEYIIKNNIKKVGILYEIDEWASLVKDAFKKRFVELGGTIVTEEGQDTTDHDYRTSLLKVFNKNPQALYIAPAYNGGYVLKQLKEINKKIAVFGPDTFGINEVITVAGETANGVVYSSVIVNEKSKAAIEFQKRYKQKYGKEGSRESQQYYPYLRFVDY